MAREAWEDVSFQVFTGMDGVLRSGYYPTGAGTVNGNVAVDYVWGNFPIQPDDDRTGLSTTVGGGAGDVAWSVTSKTVSDTLELTYTQSKGDTPVVNKTVGSSHDVAMYLWSNYPAFIENVGYQD